MRKRKKPMTRIELEERYMQEMVVPIAKIACLQRRAAWSRAWSEDELLQWLMDKVDEQWKDDDHSLWVDIIYNSGNACAGLGHVDCELDGKFPWRQMANFALVEDVLKLLKGMK